MPRKKIKGPARAILIREHKKNPGCGVRELSRLIKENHGIALSKSAIALILKKKGLQQKSGRKKALKQYAANCSCQCGLLLLRGLDSHIGLMDDVALQLQGYVQSIPKKTLIKLIYFLSLAGFCGKASYSDAMGKDFARLAGLSRLPKLECKVLEQAVAIHRPSVDISPVIEKMRLVSTIKFIFNNDSVGFTDAQMSTFWDDCCTFERFFSPFQNVAAKLSRMIKDKLFIIGYTKSFEYLSPVTFAFIEGVLSGIKTIQILDSAGKIIMEAPSRCQNATFLFGYSPSILNKGIRFVSGSGRRRKAFTERGFELYAIIEQSRVAVSGQKNELFLSNTLISEGLDQPFDWGVFCTAPKSRKNFMSYIEKYLYMNRYISKDFFKDMEAIERMASGGPEKRSDISRMLPKKVLLREPKDFSKFCQILSILFKETVGGWEPKGKSGNFSIRREAVFIHLPAAPADIKRNFNKNRFFIGKRQAIIV